MHTSSISTSVRTAVGYYKVPTEHTDVAVKATFFLSCDACFETWAGHRFLSLVWQLPRYRDSNSITSRSFPLKSFLLPTVYAVRSGIWYLREINHKTLRAPEVARFLSWHFRCTSRITQQPIRSKPVAFPSRMQCLHYVVDDPTLSTKAVVW